MSNAFQALWAKSHSQSAGDFQTIVWPYIASDKRIGGGQLRMAEALGKEETMGKEKPLGKENSSEGNMLAALDEWHVIGNRLGLRSVASKIQWRIDRRCFFIGYSSAYGNESEYSQRRLAIKNPDLGLTYPQLTVQAFLDEHDGCLLSVAAIPTQYLIAEAERLMLWKKLEDDADSRYGQKSMGDGQSYLYLSWRYLQRSQVASHIVLFNCNK